MKLGVIGCGNMGFALLNGVLKSGMAMPGETWIYDVDEQKMTDIASQLGANPAADIGDLVSHSDLVLLAVKPQNMTELLLNHQATLDQPEKIVVSIAAGYTTASFRKYLSRVRLVRVMPNTPALIGQGASALYFEGSFQDQEKRAVLKVFESCGLAELVSSEALMDAVTGLSGSGPAYVFSFLSALTDAGVKEGLPRDVSKRLAIQTVLGSAQLALRSLDDSIHLDDLKDRVTSPGGTTAAGLYALENGRFKATVMDAVNQAARRSRELGGVS